MRIRIYLLTLLLAIVGGTELLALVQVPLPIQQLINDADLVVQGKVVSRSCERDSTGRIFTKVELQVSEKWKGKSDQQPLVVVHGGGVLGEEKVLVSGQVNYEIGEEVVAFLVRNARGEAVTLAMSQGKFHVWKDPANGELYVRNPFHGGDQGEAHLHKSGLSTTTKSDRLTLSQLKAQVQERRK